MHILISLIVFYLHGPAISVSAFSAAEAVFTNASVSAGRVLLHLSSFNLAQYCVDLR